MPNPNELAKQQQVVIKEKEFLQKTVKMIDKQIMALKVIYFSI